MMITVLQFWLATTAIAALLVVLAWAGSRRRRVRVKELTAGEKLVNHCGNCGYDLTGLAGDVCPECGSDLTLVGRVAPGFKRWQAVPVTARTVIWTVAVAVMAAALFILGSGFAFPRTQPLSVSRTWTWSTGVSISGPLGPITVPGNTLTVSANAIVERDVSAGAAGYYDRESIPPGAQRWSLSNVGAYFSTPAGSLPGAQGYLLRNSDGEAAPDPSLPLLDAKRKPLANQPTNAQGALEYFITSSGYDGSFGPASDLATSLAESLRQFLETGDTFTPVDGHLYGSVYWTPVSAPVQRDEAMAGYVFAWLAVWAIGLPFIVRKRSVRVRA